MAAIIQLYGSKRRVSPSSHLLVEPCDWIQAGGIVGRRCSNIQTWLKELISHAGEEGEFITAEGEGGARLASHHRCCS